MSELTSGTPKPAGLDDDAAKSVPFVLPPDIPPVAAPSAADALPSEAAAYDEPASPAVAAATWSVAEYLRDLGVRDPELIARESRRVVQRTQRERPFASADGSEKSLSEAALQLTVKELDQWLLALAAEAGDAAHPQRLGGVVGARLPDLLSRYPEAWKRSRPSPALVESLREDLKPVVPAPRPRPMRRQTLELLPASLRFGIARIWGGGEGKGDDPQGGSRQSTSLRGSAVRLALAFLTISSTAYGALRFSRDLASNGFGVLEYALTALFAVLFLWVAFSFWMATFGLVSMLLRSRKGAAAKPVEAAPPADLPPTAVLMPIYNEEPGKVFANIRAVVQSLRGTGLEASFGVFVLSDTTDPDVWLEEERAWAKLVAQLPKTCRVFYRRRPQNIGRKAGNVADFCCRWGEHYKYMIVLDADSVMAGGTLVEMVRRMERDPRLGILQAPPKPVNRRSVFARMQQFAAHMYGPVFLEGFVLWTECDGNYWGHNAIIRVRPFMEHCELPILPGEGPLAGEILSHDFVEAALMRRAGWKICIAHDLGGSYEECPTTLHDFAQRDQRWCQGNLQHVRLLLADGLHPASRLHFGMGAMSYLASPLWLCFLILTVAVAILRQGGDVEAGYAPGGAALFVVTMAMLLVPKAWGVWATQAQEAADPKKAETEEKPAAAARDSTWGSVLIETIISMLIAPIMMLLHTRFVVSTLRGSKVKWNAQQRDDRGVSLADAFLLHYPHTLFGLGLAGVAWIWAPSLLPWLSPVLVGLLLAVPLAMVLGSGRLGEELARRGLLSIPEESVLPPVLRLQRDALEAAAASAKHFAQAADVFDLVVRDPTFYALHAGILRATEGGRPLPADLLPQVEELLRTGDLEGASPALRRAVLSDAESMEKLHLLVRSRIAPTPSALLS